MAIVKHGGEETWVFPFIGFEFIGEHIVQNECLKRIPSLHPKINGIEKSLGYMIKPTLCKLQQIRKTISLHFAVYHMPIKAIKKIKYNEKHVNRAPASLLKHHHGQQFTFQLFPVSRTRH